MLIIASVSNGNDSDWFPQPAQLASDVDFWVAIFTGYTTAEGVLHDSHNLDIVYERLSLPDNASRRQRQSVSDRRRPHYKEILQTLASGKREGLTKEEQRVLGMWPANVSEKELLLAANNIRFQAGLSDRFAEGLHRAGLYRDYINEEFKQLGIPIALAALPHVESSYDLNARSNAGASGIWQFTRGTGRRFMQVDHVLDERNDPFLATIAAGKLLSYNHSITGNWPMAITAYNHGLSGVRRAMRRYGDNNLIDILRHYDGRAFGFSSRNFYVAFLAAKEVDQNPDVYFPGLKPAEPIEYSQYRLKKYVPVNQLTTFLDISDSDLARHNPALQPTIWQGSKYLPKGYTLRVPASLLQDSLQILIDRLSPDIFFNQQLADLFHTVARGDTLSEIADVYETRVSTLVTLNNLTNRHRIRAGQKLRLPAAGPAPTAELPMVVRSSSPVTERNDGSPLTETSMKKATDVSKGAITNGTKKKKVVGGFVDTRALLSDPSDYAVDADYTIEIQALETLGHYSDWLNVRTQRLRDINKMAFRTPVEIGKRITLDFSNVSLESFEELRSNYHRQQQDIFFRTYTITDVRQHVIRRGESVWELSLREYDVPVWLFRQYNPELDMHNVAWGTLLRFPVLTENKQT